MAYTEFILDYGDYKGVPPITTIYGLTERGVKVKIAEVQGATDAYYLASAANAYKAYHMALEAIAKSSPNDDHAAIYFHDLASDALNKVTACQQEIDENHRKTTTQPI